LHAGGPNAGTDAAQQRLLFLRPSPEALRSVRLPMGMLLRLQRLTLRTDLQDNHLYVFNRDIVLPLLAAKPSLANIKQARLSSASSLLTVH
jgi:hypothetical protein